jgi:acetoin utilization protein AcuB
MLVSDYMTREVTSLNDGDSLLDAMMIFLRSTLRHLPVLRGTQLVGVITERDVKQFAPSVLSGITSEEYNQLLDTTPVSRVMTRDPITVGPDQPVLEAAKLLSSKRIGCLPVVEDGELKGIITTTDMLKLLVYLLEMESAGSEEAASSP